MHGEVSKEVHVLVVVRAQVEGGGGDAVSRGVVHRCEGRTTVDERGVPCFLVVRRLGGLGCGCREGEVREWVFGVGG